MSSHDPKPAAVGGPANAKRFKNLTQNARMCACVLMEALCWTAMD